MKSRKLTVVMIRLLAVFFCVVGAVSFAADDLIKHKFLLLDESRKQILHVDQFEPTNDWVVKLSDGGVWDLQLIGGNRLLVALTDKGGFREYDLRTREVVREVSDAKYKQTMTAIRFQDGQTLLGCNKSTYQFYLLDADGKLIKEIPVVDNKKSIRVATLTSRKTILFGCSDGWVKEIDLTGKVLREFNVPNARHIYHVLEKPDGNLLVAAGYGCFVAEYDKENKEVRRWGGLPAPDNLTFIFFSKMQVLKNGNLVVATWTGHSANDSNKGIQLVEFDSKGKVVWTWHNPKLAGSINNVIILDDLDTNKFYQ